MEYKDYEALKQEIKAWLDTHQDEYIAFYDNINGKSSEDLLRLYTKIAPNFQKRVESIFYADIVPSQKDSSPIELDEDEVSALKDAFSNFNESSVIPCICAWIFFGQFYEKMVEVYINLLEQLYKTESPIVKISKWFNRHFSGKIADHKNENDYESRIEYTITLFVTNSVELHLRTKQDWMHYIEKNSFDNKRSRVIANNAIEDALASLTEESDNICHLSSEQISVFAEEASPTEVPDYTNHSAITHIPEHKEKPKQSDSSCKMKLEDYLICVNDKQKKELIDRIKRKLPLEKAGTGLAFIYAALINLGYFDKKTYKGKKFFHQLLVNQYGKKSILCGETNFQHFVALYFNESMEISRKTDYVENDRRLQSLIEYLNVDNMACDDCNNINN